MNESFQQLTFDEFASTFLRMARSGQHYSIEEAAETFPHLATQIRQQMPALLARAKQQSNQRWDPQQPIVGCTIRRELGRGGFGIVYLAHQPDLDRDVAVKVIPLRDDNSKHAERFESERRALAKLSHPNIVPAYAYTETQGHACLVMKLVDGCTFRQLLADECSQHAHNTLVEWRTNWKSFVVVARQLASALEHAHEHGLVHRDIKPSNLMLDKSGRVWITDFGLVKDTINHAGLTSEGDTLGTPRYMAPEQMRGICDPRSDIYSLGLTFYELATGQAAHVSSQRSSRPSPLHLQGLQRNLPNELARIIEKCCAIDPDARFQSAKELGVVLDRFLADQVPDRRRKQRLADHLYRRDLLVKVAVGLAAGLAVGIVPVLMPQERQEPPPIDTTVQDTVSFFSDLADAPNSNLNEVVRNLTLHSAKEASDTMGLRSNEQAELLYQVGSLIGAVEAGDVPPEVVETLLQRYRSSHVSLGVRIMRLHELVAQSTLTSADKLRVNAAIRRLAQLAVHKQITAEQAEEMILALTKTPAKRLSDLRSLDLADSHLMDWAEWVETETQGFEMNDDEVTDEIRWLFADALKPDSFSTRAVTSQPPTLQEDAARMLDAVLQGDGADMPPGAEGAPDSLEQLLKSQAAGLDLDLLRQAIE